jgi:hypothetical protein
MDPVKSPRIDLSPALEDVFAKARVDDGDAERLTGIAARLGPVFDEPRAPVIAIGRPRRTRQVAIVAALLAACVAIGFAASRFGRDVEVPAPRVPSAAPIVPAPVAAPSSVASAEPIEPAPTAEPSVIATARSRPAPPPAASESASPVVEEHALLREARQSLDSNPSETLARVAEHQKRFPRGVLGVEREFLRIAALARLGRTGEARAARDAFVARFPKSAYRSEIDRLVGP